MMKLLRWVFVLVLLLQLTKAEFSTSDGSVDEITAAANEDHVKGSTWGDEATPEDVVEEESAEEEVEPGKAAETPDEPYERKLSPRERIVIEEEERWQRLEELAKRESEAASHDSDSVEEPPEEVEADAWKRSNDHEELYEQAEENDDQEEDDGTLAAYLERKRRLEDQSTDLFGDDEEEAEALPVIPGLTDVELVAFNAEYANEEVLDKIIDWSYDQVAALSRFRDNYIHVEDLYQFLLKTLNPLDEEIDQQDEEILTEAVAELRRQQGLVDEEQVVYRGFIARGMPLRFLQSLAHEMHQTVQTRRLQANDEL